MCGSDSTTGVLWECVVADSYRNLPLDSLVHSSGTHRRVTEQLKTRTMEHSTAPWDSTSRHRRTIDAFRCVSRVDNSSLRSSRRCSWGRSCHSLGRTDRLDREQLHRRRRSCLADTATGRSTGPSESPVHTNRSMCLWARLSQPDSAAWATSRSCLTSARRYRRHNSSLHRRSPNRHDQSRSRSR